MEAKSFFPNCQDLQAINEKGMPFPLRLGVGEGWDQERDLPTPSLYLGNIFYLTVDALNFRILCIQI